MWRDLKLVLTIRCEQSSRLISDECERRLNPIERFAAALHRVNCRWCRRFRSQVAVLQALAEQPPPAPAQLSPAARQRITRALSERS
ncbi:MAG: hypothetical protein AAF333_17040 [Planctomycetota bacterium]